MKIDTIPASETHVTKHNVHTSVFLFQREVIVVSVQITSTSNGEVKALVMLHMRNQRYYPILYYKNFISNVRFTFQPQPLVCKCQNGGICQESEDGMTECKCEENFVGQYCDVRRDVALHTRASTPAAVIVPVLLIIFVIISAVALYVYYQRKRGE